MSDQTIAFLIVLGIMIAWGVFRSVRKAAPSRKTDTARAHTRKPDTARAHALAVYGMGRLIQKGFSDYLLSDYRFQTQISSPKNASLSLLEQQLQSALMEMLTHLHQLPDIRLLVTDDPAKLSGPGRLGEYVHDYRAKEIRILIQKDWSAEILLAGLCHECAHYFMYSFGLDEANPDNNEGLTDTMACLIGFSQTMIARGQDHALPYLNTAELQIVRKTLLEKRAELSQSRNREKELAAKKAQLRKNISGARELYRQAEAVLTVRKNPDTAKMTKQQLASVSETLLGMETKTFEQAFQRAESALAGDLAHVTRADEEVLQICAKLYSLLLLYRA